MPGMMKRPMYKKGGKTKKKKTFPDMSSDGSNEGEKIKWQNFVQEVKPQRSESSRSILRHMQICMHQLFAVVKLHQVVKRKIEKKLWVVE
jgi:hypothetical protein